MKVIEQSFDFVGYVSSTKILNRIEQVARTCYKSEPVNDDPNRTAKFVKSLIQNGHEAMLEHCNITVRIITDGGISHELVRHRIASYAQESTRYCNYSQDRFDNQVTFIKPIYWADDSDEYCFWHDAMKSIEQCYFKMLGYGATPQEARSVLPNSLKTEIVVTMNLREWRHFFKLRTSINAHPQMRALAAMMLQQFKDKVSIVFDDINY